jgi:hypothetical protein
MNRWRVGEDRGSKEKDRCPLTICKIALHFALQSRTPLCSVGLSYTALHSVERLCFTKTF